MLKNLPMVASREGKKMGEGDIVEEENLLNPKNKMDVIQELIALIDGVQSIGDFRRTQRKEAHSLVRRMKLLLPLLEEIRDIDTQIPETGMTCLCNLKRAFSTAKKLLKMCNEGSKIYLALESEDVMIRFHSVYEKLNQALDGMPYAEIGISEEVKEQEWCMHPTYLSGDTKEQRHVNLKFDVASSYVHYGVRELCGTKFSVQQHNESRNVGQHITSIVELLRMQLRRAKRRTDTQDMELAMDMMVVISDDRNADSASIERLANKLALHTVEDLRTETVAIRKLVKERGQNIETNKQIVDILSKCKQIAGLEDTGILDDPAVPKALAKCPSLAIPNEFLCPITLEIMSDPVIVATGQTYERESIQKWLDSDHRTCPKTGQSLAHLSLAPNFALRNLILQWCEKNNFQLPKKEAPTSSENSNVEHNNEISSVVQQLSSNQLEVQRKAVRKIRMLSKENPENRILVANNGGIPPLVQLLSYPDSKIQEHAVTALLNLSIDESNKKLISREQPIPAMVEILQNGTIGAKENTAAALFSLSMLDENKANIALSNGIPPLVGLLKNGTIRGKKDAVTALFNLSLCQKNKVRAIEAGIVAPLLHLLEDKKLDMVNESLSLLLLLASNSEGSEEIGQVSVINTLVQFIKEGTPKNKECAVALVLELGTKNPNLVLAALQYGVYEYVVELEKSGTNRGQRKANSLLQLMSKSEPIS